MFIIIDKLSPNDISHQQVQNPAGKNILKL